MKRTLREIVLFGGHQQIGETLDEVYRAEKGLCWEIKGFFWPKRTSLIQSINRENYSDEDKNITIVSGCDKT